MDEWMTAEAAAARLGVKAQTLYAYVSRGMIGSEPVPGSRRSRFRRADVERLAGRRGAGGRRAGTPELVVDTQLTLIDPAGRLYYRGRDVADLVAAGTSFEAVAALLWTGVSGGTTTDEAVYTRSAGLMGGQELLETAGRVSAALGEVPLLDRLRAVVAAIRHVDPLRDDRRPEAVAATGRGLLATLARAVPARVEPAGPSLADLVWAGVADHPPSPDEIALVNAALVVLADHELAASTLAARVTASTWADPYLVVETGLCALGGPLHGAASRGARHLLAPVVDGSRTAAEAVGAALRGGGGVPGFGHPIYERADPRADLLLARLDPGLPAAEAAAQVAAVVAERGLGFPNIDFALAAVAEGHEMIDEGPELIFALARTAGWLAHAIEEYEHRLRFRTRAIYTGPAPP